MLLMGPVGGMSVFFAGGRLSNAPNAALNVFSKLCPNMHPAPPRRTPWKTRRRDGGIQEVKGGQGW